MTTLSITNPQLAGYFTLRVRDAVSNKVVKTVGPFRNLITNQGLDFPGLGKSLVFAFVGTGNNTPSTSDVTMGAFKAYSNSASGVTRAAPAAPDYFAQASRTYTFDAGTISGNITEVGVGNSSVSTQPIFSRELIKDTEGNPVTVTVLPTEILDIVYTLRLYVPQTDSTGSFVLNGVTYNYTIRASDSGAWSCNLHLPSGQQPGQFIMSARTGVTSLGPITDSLVGGATTTTPNRENIGVYTSGSYSRTGRSSFGLDQGNSSAGLNGFKLQSYLSSQAPLDTYFQVLLDKPIPKTELNTMSFDWAMSWSRRL